MIYGRKKFMELAKKYKNNPKAWEKFNEDKKNIPFFKNIKIDQTKNENIAYNKSIVRYHNKENSKQNTGNTNITQKSRDLKNESKNGIRQLIRDHNMKKSNYISEVQERQKQYTINSTIQEWHNFLKHKEVEDPQERKDIINFYLFLQNLQGNDILNCPSLKEAWLGKGVNGAVLKINGKVYKYENYNAKEINSLNLLSQLKRDNEIETEKFRGKNNKDINEINSSKYVNAPSMFGEYAKNDKKMVSEYDEIARCTFWELMEKQKELRKKIKSQKGWDKWILLQQLIVGNLVTQILKALNLLHSHNQVHGDLHCNNILVSTRQSLRRGNFKIKFLLHDRGYDSGLIGLRNNLKERVGFENQVLQKKSSEIFNVLCSKNTKVNRGVVIDYLKMWDLEELLRDVYGCLNKVGLREDFLEGLSEALSVLKCSEDATEALQSPEITVLRRIVNDLNSNSDIDNFL